MFWATVLILDMLLGIVACIIVLRYMYIVRNECLTQRAAVRRFLLAGWTALGTVGSYEAYMGGASGFRYIAIAILLSTTIWLYRKTQPVDERDVE